MIVLPCSCRPFALAIAATSPGAWVVERAAGWVVTGERLVIDPVACAQALGRPLDMHEREELLCRQTGQQGWAVSRLGKRVYLEPYRPTTSLTLRMPLALGDTIKAEIGARDLSVKDFVCLALRWYAATWDDGDPDTKAQVMDEYRDLHHWTGPRVKPGAIDERRWATHRGTDRKEAEYGLVSDEEENGGGMADGAGGAGKSIAADDALCGPRSRRGRALVLSRGLLDRLRADRRTADAD